MNNTTNNNITFSSLVNTFLQVAFKNEKEAEKEGSFLHYMMAHDKPINQIKKKYKKADLNTQDSLYKLTPLAVSVMKKNIEMVKFLLKEGADVTLKDYKGWTPIHHAVLNGNKKILQLLESKISQVAKKNFPNQESDKSKELVNLVQGNYNHLQKILESNIPDPKETVCLIHNPNGEAEKCNAEHFKELTGAVFCNNTIGSDKEIFEEWCNVSTSDEYSDDELSVLIGEQYKILLENPPKISFGKDTDNLPAWGYDIFAEQDIDCYKGVALYGGKLNSNPSSSDYRMGGIDAGEVRHLGAMINDGFPNCTSYHASYEGSLGTFCFLTLRDIKKGEKLFFNYGLGHPIKLIHPHSELNPSDLIKFIEEKPLEKRLENFLVILDHLSKNPTNLPSLKESLDFLSERLKLSYVLDTPSAWIYLISQNVFPVEQFKPILTHLKARIKGTFFQQEHVDFREEFGKKCCKLEEILQQSCIPEMVVEIREVLLKWSESFEVTLIDKLLVMLTGALELYITSLDQWNEFKADLTEFVDLQKLLFHYSKGKIGHECLKEVEQLFNHLSEKKKQLGVNTIQEVINILKYIINENASRLSKWKSQLTMNEIRNYVTYNLENTIRVGLLSELLEKLKKEEKPL